MDYPKSMFSSTIGPLRRCTDVVCSKCSKFVVGKKSAVGDKGVTRKHGRPISWDRLPYATQPLLNMEDAERQKITVRILCSYASGPLTSAFIKFIEIWNEDGVTAEPEDDFA